MAENQETTKTHASQVAILGCVVLAVFFFYRGLIPPTQLQETSVSTAPVVNVSYGSATHARLPTKSIEEVQLGERVAGRNPLREEVDRSIPDPASWRKITLHMQKNDGQSLHIELLRPLDWIDQQEAFAGQTIQLDLLEMDALGSAEVLSVVACPDIQPGTGAIVTGRFVHQVAPGSNVLRIQLEGDAGVLGVTENHPFWCEERACFVEAGELRAGEFVNTSYGARRIAAVVQDLDYRGRLYNLETTEHIYRVGTLGTLVHNNSGSDLPIVNPNFTPKPGIGTRASLPANPARPIAGKWPAIMKDGKVYVDHFHSLANQRANGGVIGPEDAYGMVTLDAIGNVIGVSW